MRIIICIDCNEEKEIQGLNRCSSCYSKYYYQLNKKRIARRTKLFRENNKDKIKKRYEDTKDERKEYDLKRSREYYEKNKEKVRIRHKKYYDENRDVILEYNRDPKDRHKRLARATATNQKMKSSSCFHCGSKELLEFHHTDYEKNEGYTLCKICHSKEHVKLRQLERK